MTNEQEYWIIKSVCTYRAFDEPSPPNFDGEKFFQELRKELAKENEKFLGSNKDKSESSDSDAKERKPQYESCKIIRSSNMEDNTTTMTHKCQRFLTTSNKKFTSMKEKQKCPIKIASSHYTNSLTTKPILPSLLHKMQSNVNTNMKPFKDTTITNKNILHNNIIPINNQVTYTTKSTTATTLSSRNLLPSLRKSFSFDTSYKREPYFIQQNSPNKKAMLNTLKPAKSFIHHEPDLPKYAKFNLKRSASIGPDYKPSFLGSRIRTNFIESTNVVTKIKNSFKMSNDKIKNVVEKLTKQKIQLYK